MKPSRSAPEWKSRWPTYAALALALIAVVIAIVALFRPFDSGSSYNSQQTAAAKAGVCSGFAVVRQAVVINTHLSNPRPDEPSGTLAVAANARLALLGGGAYLQNRLTAAPAAPADLTKTVRYMADTIEQLGINYLAGAPNEVQDPLRSNLDQQIKAVAQLCA